MVVAVTDVVVVVVVVVVAEVIVVDVCVVVVAVVVDVHGNPQSVGQCFRAKSPNSPKSTQSVWGRRVPQPTASRTSLQGCKTYVVVVPVTVVPDVVVAVTVVVEVVVVEVAVSVVVDVDVQAMLHITWHNVRASSPTLPCTMQSAACTRSPHTSGSILPLHVCRLYVVVVAVVTDVVVAVVVVVVAVVIVAVDVEDFELVVLVVEVAVLHAKLQRSGQCMRAKVPCLPVSVQSDDGIREPQICVRRQVTSSSPGTNQQCERQTQNDACNIDRTYGVRQSASVCTCVYVCAACVCEGRRHMHE